MHTQMTRADFYRKYGKVAVAFVSYHKYTFEYGAALPDGRRVLVSYGGSADDIYRHEVEPNVPEIIESLQPYAGTVYDGPVEIEGFYDF